MKKWNITRAQQDAFAAKSQQKVEESQRSGHFDQEIVPVFVPGKKGPTEVKVDEFPRAGTTTEGLARLRPCFITVSVSADCTEHHNPHLHLYHCELLKYCKCFFPQDGSGSVTAGNSSGINDGAAALVLARESEAKQRGLEPMAHIVAWAQAGVDPTVMGTGPIPAVKAAVSWNTVVLILFYLQILKLHDLKVLKRLSLFSLLHCIAL